jgi:MerR family transcriptional regulator, light-induced transcriptional regulator
MNRSAQHREVQARESQLSDWDDCSNSDDFKADLGRLAQAAAIAPRSELSTSQMGWLMHTIEDEIIPRLLKTARTMTPADDAHLTHARNAAAVKELAQLILENHAGVAGAYIESLRAEGLSLETIYLDIMSPVARRLGEMWEEDLCDFTSVTIGLWRLQQLMHDLSPAFQDDAAHGVHVLRTMLVPVPGSQHTLGLLMVAEFFRRAGWDVWGDPAASVKDLLQAVKNQQFDLVGFSVGSETQFDLLTSTIKDIRKHSSNSDIRVMVGGPVIVANPALVGVLGADGTAPDASQAVQVARALMAAQKAVPA